MELNDLARRIFFEYPKILAAELRAVVDERYAFDTWLQHVFLPQIDLPEKKVPTPDQFESLLAENIHRLNREARVEGREEGIQQGEVGILLRQLRLKFGPLDAATESRVRSADADRLLEWGDRVLSAERLEDVFQ